MTGKINNTLNIRTKFQLFDPDDPARYQVYADVSSEYALSNHWAIRSSIAINLDQNFDESNRQESDSVLPKVRSDVVKYLNKGDSGLEKLIVEGRDTIGRRFITVPLVVTSKPCSRVLEARCCIGHTSPVLLWCQCRVRQTEGL